VNHRFSQVQQTTVGPRSPSSTGLRGRRLFIVRAVWVAVSALVLGLFVVSVPVAYAHFHDICAGPGCGFFPLSPEDARALQEFGLSAGFYAAYNVALDVVYTLGFCGVGALVFWRKSEEWMPLLASLALVLFGADTLDMLVEEYPVWWLPVTFINCLGAICFFIFFYLFPDGRFMPRWTRVPAVIWIVYLVPFYFFPDSPFSASTWPDLLGIPLLLGLLTTLVFAQIYRYRLVSGPIERQQTKWVVFGFTLTIVVIVGIILVGVTLSFTQPGDPGVLYSMVNRTVLYLAFLLVPLSIGIAILRYHLWDIDLIIRRSLVIGPLLTILTVVFELATQLLLPFVFQFIPALEDSSSIKTVVSVLIVVVLFKPLHARLDADVNRVVDWLVGGRQKSRRLARRRG
jgi:hypothetical protein